MITQLGKYTHNRQKALTVKQDEYNYKKEWGSTVHSHNMFFLKFRNASI